MPNDIFASLDGLSPEEEEVRETVVKSVFNYPGSKARGIRNILPHLPYSRLYVEPFGGSAAVLLARHESKIEVYNDKYSGVVDFYRCIVNKDLCEQLVQRLELTVHSREEFDFCKTTMNDNGLDKVERAARWYYRTIYSFGSLGRNFGRSTYSASTLAGKIQSKLPGFQPLHERFKNVQVECLDWSVIFKDFDSYETVFYCDPPYLEVSGGTYRLDFTRNEHIKFLNQVFNLKGFCAVSSYPNTLYDSYDWDNFYSWDQFVSLTNAAMTETNNQNVVKDRGTVKECLYIKEIQ